MSNYLCYLACNLDEESFNNLLLTMWGAHESAFRETGDLSHIDTFVRMLDQLSLIDNRKEMIRDAQYVALDVLLLEIPPADLSVVLGDRYPQDLGDGYRYIGLRNLTNQKLADLSHEIEMGWETKSSVWLDEMCELVVKLSFGGAYKCGESFFREQEGRCGLE